LKQVAGEQRKRGLFEYAYVGGLDDDLKESLFEIFRGAYLSHREFLGGSGDPLFWGTYAATYNDVVPENVGVVEVEAYLPIPLREANYLATRDPMQLHELSRDYGGDVFMGAMSEIRLPKDRFHKLRVL
jgi:hypothetical protein